VSLVLCERIPHTEAVEPVLVRFLALRDSSLQTHEPLHLPQRHTGDQFLPTFTFGPLGLASLLRHGDAPPTTSGTPIKRASVTKVARGSIGFRRTERRWSNAHATLIEQ